MRRLATTSAFSLKRMRSPINRASSLLAAISLLFLQAAWSFTPITAMAQGGNADQDYCRSRSGSETPGNPAGTLKESCVSCSLCQSARQLQGGFPLPEAQNLLRRDDWHRIAMVFPHDLGADAFRPITPHARGPPVFDRIGVVASLTAATPSSG